MGKEETESGIVENEGSVVTTSVEVKSRRRTIKMKDWNEIIRVTNPDGIVFITMSYEQLTVYAGFISSTIICSSKERIKVKDKTDDAYVYVIYEGQPFHN
jgi:hypothetical protein